MMRPPTNISGRVGAGADASGDGHEDREEQDISLYAFFQTSAKFL